MNFLKILLTFSLFSSLSAKQPSMDTLDQIASSSVHFWKVPGCAISIVSQGKIILEKSYGLKNLKTEEFTNTHTLFPIASLSKLFTAITLGILSDRQILKWDDPVINAYPALKLSDPYATTHLTYRDCLSMRSGLPGPAFNDFIFSSESTAEELLLNKLPQLPFKQGFRSHFAYQNLLYLLATKPFISWTDFLKKEVLIPLFMEDTAIHFGQFQKSQNKATLYQWDTNHFNEVAPENLDNLYSAAGLYSSVHDMTQFLLSMQTLLSPDTLTEIFTPQTPVVLKEFFSEENTTEKEIFFPHSNFICYGLGCFIHDYRGTKIIQVPGWTDGATPVLAIIPELNLSLCILTNAESSAFSHALLFQIIDAYMGQSTDWNNHFLHLSLI